MHSSWALWQCNWLEETGTICSLFYDITNKVSQPYSGSRRAIGPRIMKPMGISATHRISYGGGTSEGGASQTDRVLLSQQRIYWRISGELEIWKRFEWGGLHCESELFNGWSNKRRSPRFLNHIDEQLMTFAKQECPHPLCHVPLMNASGSLAHVQDAHCIEEPRSDCVSRKRKSEVDEEYARDTKGEALEPRRQRLIMRR
jgi:hypothetical protein